MKLSSALLLAPLYATACSAPPAATPGLDRSATPGRTAVVAPADDGVTIAPPAQPIDWKDGPPTQSAYDLQGCAPAYDVAVGILHISSSGGCNLPALIHIHGGGWFSGAASDMDVYRDAEVGNHVVYVSVEYPLFPTPMSTMLSSIHLAIDFLRIQHLLLGIDPGRIGVIGESAGGQLALQVGNEDGDLRFVGSLFGPTDMRAEQDLFCRVYAGLAPGQQLCLAVDTIMGGSPAQAPQNYDAFSPLHSAPALAGHQQAPRFYFGESAGDLLVPIGTVDQYSGLLASHGLPVLNDRLPAEPGVIGHNLGPDQLNFLRARALLDAINAFNGPALPPPAAFAAPPAGAPPGGPPPPAPPPSSCSCSCSGQIGLATASHQSTAATCDAARAAAVPPVQNALFTDVQLAGPPWTLWYTLAAGIPVACQCS